MNVLIVSPEVTPFAKTGGLADVAGALPKHLAALDINTILMMPDYGIISDDIIHREDVDVTFSVRVGKDLKPVTLSKGRINDKIDIYFVGNAEYYDRDGIYGGGNGDYHDNLERFTFFSRAVLEGLKQINWKPDIIHCHDWQTGLVPAYMKTIYRDDPFYGSTSVVFTIHNLAYQGNFTTDKYYIIGLGWDEFVYEKIEYYGKFSLLKAGIVYSDKITTVSETYSREIQTRAFGCGFEGVLEWRSKDLVGIINGIDYTIWNPGEDEFIKKNYSIKNIKSKAVNKKDILKESNLPSYRKKDVPLIGIISRLAEQKGFDLIKSCINELMSFDMQVVILGTGTDEYHTLLKETQERYPKKIALHLKFDESLAHKIYAGSDIFLMPSRYEPCGLGQLIAMKYGTVPVVFSTGGLADTVSNYDVYTKRGNGVVFEAYVPSELVSSVEKGIALYKNKTEWFSLVSNCMNMDFSWKESAKKYRDLFQGLV